MIQISFIQNEELYQVVEQSIDLVRKSARYVRDEGRVYSKMPHSGYNVNYVLAFHVQVSFLEENGERTDFLRHLVQFGQNE